MWLPNPIYEAIPLYYLVLGAAGLGAAFYVDRWYWPEILAVGGLIVIVVGIALMLRRKGYRSSRSRLDFDDN